MVAGYGVQCYRLCWGVVVLVTVVVTVTVTVGWDSVWHGGSCSGAVFVQGRRGGTVPRIGVGSVGRQRPMSVAWHDSHVWGILSNGPYGFPPVCLLPIPLGPLL